MQDKQQMHVQFSILDYIKHEYQKLKQMINRVKTLPFRIFEGRCIGAALFLFENFLIIK